MKWSKTKNIAKGTFSKIRNKNDRSEPGETMASWTLHGACCIREKIFSTEPRGASIKLEISIQIFPPITDIKIPL